MESKHIFLQILIFAVGTYGTPKHLSWKNLHEFQMYWKPESCESGLGHAFDKASSLNARLTPLDVNATGVWSGTKMGDRIDVVLDWGMLPGFCHMTFANLTVKYYAAGDDEMERILVYPCAKQHHHTPMGKGICFLNPPQDGVHWVTATIPIDVTRCRKKLQLVSTHDDRSSAVFLIDEVHLVHDGSDDCHPQLNTTTSATSG